MRGRKRDSIYSACSNRQHGIKKESPNEGTETSIHHYRMKNLLHNKKRIPE